jgi:hypothetical protein
MHCFIAIPPEPVADSCFIWIILSAPSAVNALFSPGAFVFFHLFRKQLNIYGNLYVLTKKLVRIMLNDRTAFAHHERKAAIKIGE